MRRSRCAVAVADTDDADVVGPLFAAREADITGGIARRAPVNTVRASFARFTSTLVSSNFTGAQR